MENLPENVRELFEARFKEFTFKHDIIRRVKDKTNGTVYYIREYKDEPTISYRDFINNVFIPRNDYNDRKLILRTDFDNRDENYVSTAHMAYVIRHIMNRDVHQEILEENPRKGGKVDFETEI
jgi:hypothetical protein